jgi:general secretion pathway protein G
MKTPFRRHPAAFTLIELMAVITIIIILAGLVVGGMGFVQERQAKEKAKLQIALLSKAIEEFKLEMGRLPGKAENTPSAGTVTQELYEELFYEGYEYNKASTPPPKWEKTITVGTGSVTVPKATRIFLPQLDPTSTKQGWIELVTGTNATPPPPGTKTKITDPWGKEYSYRKGTTAINPDFDLWSHGKNGKSQPDSTSSSAQKDNADDIKNF